MMPSSILNQIKAVYDRAALIALPPPTRQAYAQQLAQIIPKGTQVLLIVLDYPQAQHTPPPYAVSDAEVQHLFSKTYHCQQLLSEDIMDIEPKFAVDFLNQNVYLLHKH